MVFCGTSSTKRDAALKTKRKQNASTRRVLLLGAGKSGKSTFRKQMQFVMGNGFALQDRQQMIGVVYSNIITNIKTLLKACEHLHSENPKLGTAIKKRHEKVAKEFCLRIADDAKITAPFANHIQTLWNSPAIRRAWDQRSRYDIPESAAYFFDRLEAISQPDYVPCDMDLLKAYVRTTGVIDVIMTTRTGKRFEVIDMGGHRHERQKWRHCLHGSRAIIFVVSLSEYDEVSADDQSMSKLDESLLLFKSIAANEHLANVKISLVFTKFDLLAEKLHRSNIRASIPDYKGSETDAKAASQFIVEMFQSKIAKRRLESIHIVDMTDHRQSRETIHRLNMESLIAPIPSV